ncbi:MAG: serine/threonine protein phosphatase [Myxococcales bacterium]|nr:serine/threonine protein phosphatase [Myxococcales bacterium]
MGRTFVIGDVHGELDALMRVLSDLPKPSAADTIVFLGDYLDRGPRSREVVEFVRQLELEGTAKVVALRGNHEDAWLKVIDHGWDGFLLPRGNGCLETLRSYQHLPPPAPSRQPTSEEWALLHRGGFFPPEVVAWMRRLPFFYEDEHAIYLHAGIPAQNGVYLHPSKVKPQNALLWLRDRDFFVRYRGKYLVFGHTVCATLPQEFSAYTPEDPSDAFAGPCLAGIDTGAGKKKGFLTALELPARRVYESRRKIRR